MKATIKFINKKNWSTFWQSEGNNKIVSYIDLDISLKSLKRYWP